MDIAPSWSELFSPWGGNGNMTKNLPDWIHYPFSVTSFAIIVIGLIMNFFYGCLCVRRICSMEHNIDERFALNELCMTIMYCVVSGISAPFARHAIMYKEWIFGKSMCKMIPVMQGYAQWICLHMQMVISYQRYSILVHGNHVKTLYPVLAMFGSGFFIIFPLVFFYTVSTKKAQDGSFYYSCHETWINTDLLKAYSILLLLSHYISPAITVCYYNKRIATFLEQHVHGNIAIQGQRYNETMRALQYIWMFLWVCYGPLQIFNFLWDWSPPLNVSKFLPGEMLKATVAICQIFAMSACIVNPAIYSYGNSEIRAQIITLYGQIRTQMITLYESIANFISLIIRMFRAFVTLIFGRQEQQDPEHAAPV